MTRDEAIQAGLDALRQGQIDALGGAFDAGLSNGTPVGFTQADIDAAVAAAQAVDAQVLSDAQAASAASVAAVQLALDEMTAKEQLEEVAVADVQAKVTALKASMDAFLALFPIPVVP